MSVLIFVGLDVGDEFKAFMVPKSMFTGVKDYSKGKDYQAREAGQSQDTSVRSLPGVDRGKVLELPPIMPTIRS